MLSKIVSYISMLAVLAISLSFCQFMIDEVKLASTRKQATISVGGQEQAVPVLRDEHGRQLGRGETRTRIDNVSDKLTGSFETITSAQDPWVMRFSAFLLGFAFWGLTLQWLARSLTVWTNGSGRRPSPPAHAPI